MLQFAVKNNQFTNNLALALKVDHPPSRYCVSMYLPNLALALKVDHPPLSHPSLLDSYLLCAVFVPVSG